MTTRFRHLVVSLGVAGCGSVSGGDSSLWTPTLDLGRTSFHLPADAPGAGGTTDSAGGAPSAGTGGQPPGEGGSTSFGSGGAAGTAIGTGGSDQGATGGSGSGGLPPATGGSSAGTGGMLQGSGGTITTNSGKCTFSFSATTVTANGRYHPSNAGAIWITDSNNVFVKTLRTWSNRRRGEATAWVQSSNSNTTDAVTGATRTHGPIDATWDCTNLSRAAVADGQYAVHITFAEANALFGPPPIQTSTNFVKSPAGDDVSGQDTANFKSIHVRLTIP